MATPMFVGRRAKAPCKCSRESDPRSQRWSADFSVNRELRLRNNRTAQAQPSEQSRRPADAPRVATESSRSPSVQGPSDFGVIMKVPLGLASNQHPNGVAVDGTR